MIVVIYSTGHSISLQLHLKGWKLTCNMSTAPWKVFKPLMFDVPRSACLKSGFEVRTLGLSGEEMGDIKLSYVFQVSCNSFKL